MSGVNNNRPPRPDFSGLSPNRLYPRRAIEKKLDLGKNTLTDWVAKGLPVYGAGMKTDLFLGAEVIAFALKRPKPKDDLKRSRTKRK